MQQSWDDVVVTTAGDLHVVGTSINTLLPWADLPRFLDWRAVSLSQDVLEEVQRRRQRAKTDSGLRRRRGRLVTRTIKPVSPSSARRSTTHEDGCEEELTVSEIDELEREMQRQQEQWRRYDAANSSLDGRRGPFDGSCSGVPRSLDGAVGQGPHSLDGAAGQGPHPLDGAAGQDPHSLGQRDDSGFAWKTAGEAVPGERARGDGGERGDGDDNHNLWSTHGGGDASYQPSQGQRDGNTTKHLWPHEPQQPESIRSRSERKLSRPPSRRRRGRRKRRRRVEDSLNSSTGDIYMLGTSRNRIYGALSYTNSAPGGVQLLRSPGGGWHFSDQSLSWGAFTTEEDYLRSLLNVNVELGDMRGLPDDVPADVAKALGDLVNIPPVVTWPRVAAVIKAVLNLENTCQWQTRMLVLSIIASIPLSAMGVLDAVLTASEIDPHYVVRAQAALTLRALMRPHNGAEGALFRLLFDESNHVRATAFGILTRLMYRGETLAILVEYWNLLEKEKAALRNREPFPSPEDEQSYEALRERTMAQVETHNTRKNNWNVGWHLGSLSSRVSLASESSLPPDSLAASASRKRRNLHRRNSSTLLTSRGGLHGSTDDESSDVGKDSHIRGRRTSHLKDLEHLANAMQHARSPGQLVLEDLAVLAVDRDGDDGRERTLESQVSGNESDNTYRRDDELNSSFGLFLRGDGRARHGGGEGERAHGPHPSPPQRPRGGRSRARGGRRGRSRLSQSVNVAPPIEEETLEVVEKISSKLPKAGLAFGSLSLRPGGWKERTIQVPAGTTVRRVKPP